MMILTQKGVFTLIAQTLGGKITLRERDHVVVHTDEMPDEYRRGMVLGMLVGRYGAEQCWDVYSAPDKAGVTFSFVRRMI